MTFRSATLCLPTADRRRAHAFYGEGLGLETPGEPADDGVPEPLQVVLGDGLTVMMIPAGGFGWATAGRATAAPGTVECLLSVTVGSAGEVDDLLARALAGGGEIVSAAEQQPWGYSGSFADPDGHLWEVLAPPA